MKIVNIELEDDVFLAVTNMAKKHKRSTRAEIAVIVENRLKENYAAGKK